MKDLFVEEGMRVFVRSGIVGSESGRGVREEKRRKGDRMRAVRSKEARSSQLCEIYEVDSWNHLRPERSSRPL
jgi:hypothetical protein